MTTQYRLGHAWSLSRYVGLSGVLLMEKLSTAFEVLPTSSAPDYIDGCIDGLTELIELRIRERPLSDFLVEF